MSALSPTSLFLKAEMIARLQRSVPKSVFSYSLAVRNTKGPARSLPSSSCTSSLWFSRKQYCTLQQAECPLLLARGNSLSDGSSTRVIAAGSSPFLSSAFACSTRSLRRNALASSSSSRFFSSYAKKEMFSSHLFSPSVLISEWFSSAIQQSRRNVTTQGEKKEEKDKAENSEEKKEDDEKTKEEEKQNEKTAGSKEDPLEEPRVSFFARIKRDIKDYPDIYNSVNGMHFLLFLVFCLVSTATPSENSFWKNKLCISDRLHPLAWWAHSFVTDNFMTMTYAMMLMHMLVIQMIPVWGIKRVQAFVVATAGISGALMWLGNYMYYQWYKEGTLGMAPEFQYGPWDVVHGLLVAQYLHLAIPPLRSILSFHGWLKYASGVGAICIWYFDWQPTLFGIIVGTTLCKATPWFKVIPVKVG